MNAAEYNAAQLASGTLTADHVAELVRHWQATHKLQVDGMAGARETIPSIAAAIAEREHATSTLTLPTDRCWPLRALADGRKPQITSQFRRPDRPAHPGVDVFYRYVATDPAMRVGDGGRERNWWIPEGTHAIAVADGTVVLASKVATGFRVWLDVGHGLYSGYFHLSSIAVAVGQRVEKGAALGIIGDNPIDTDADHLHFELHRGTLDQYPRGLIDPEELLGSSPYLPA